MKSSYLCSHCRGTFTDPLLYVQHVSACIADAMFYWDSEAYSKRYFAQVRAISRYRQAGTPRWRSPFKAWAWWSVKPDGPALVRAEVAGGGR